MRISVFGLGYVGAVTSACFAELGNDVVGVDIAAAKVDMVKSGKSPIHEPELEPMLARHVASGKLTATTDTQAAARGTDLSLICVGTPSKPNGSLNTHYVERVCEEIGDALKTKNEYHVVVIRSTSLPHVCEEVFVPILEKHGGKKAGEGFGFAVHPEFLREGTAVKDFFHPPRTIIGTHDQRCGKIIASLYDKIDAPMLITTPRAAMMVKYTDNAFHALKVAFGNEIGRVCKQLGIDSQDVMKIVCQDTKLNISPLYLRPAFAFGGSCLPKDLRAITHQAMRMDVEAPLLRGILASNDAHIDALMQLVQRVETRKIGLFGLTFKSGTDDLRESAAVRLAERLIGRGYDVAIYDPHVSLSKLVGANRQYIENQIPHLARLLRETDAEVLAHGDVLIVTDSKFDWETAKRNMKSGQTIIDVDGKGKSIFAGDLRYTGLCW